MCGIVGIFNPKGIANCDKIELMSNAIIHRGPDSFGKWINENRNVILGHRRLSIIDLSDNGNQPMISYNGRYIIVYNGEIYNYIELATELKKLGVKGELQNDTRVLLEGYALLGEKILNKLDGMFAFTIYDTSENTMFCARDRFGEKPFFYTIYEGVFYFASEIKSFWAVHIRKQIREEALFDFAYSNSVVDEEYNDYTFFDKIYKIKPGQYIIISTISDIIDIDKKTYWYLNSQLNVPISYNSALETLRALITDSVKLRLRSDVKFGIALSGGIDSSLIAAIIKKELGNSDIDTYSARFNNFQKDEGEAINLILDKLKFSNKVSYPTDDGLCEDFEKLCYHQDEPFRSTNMYSQYKVMELARLNNLKVMISGQGADEIFGGYYFYREIYYNQLRKYKISEYKNAQKVDDLIFKKNIYEKVKISFRHNFPETYLKLYLFNNYLNTNRYSKNFEKEFFSKHKGRLNKQNQKLTLKEGLISHINSGLLEELLRYDDRNSMAHSVEARQPFLNHKIVEFALSLPDDFLIKYGFGKYILRDLNSKFLPEEISWNRNKIGFATPNSINLRRSLMNKYPFGYHSYFNQKILLEEFKISSYILFR
jgi:asparagine synthase (glutamine-hydrolysing)